jgi:hypothetical protein
MSIFRDYCAFFFYLSVTAVLIGFFTESESVMAFGTFTAGLSYAGRDYFDERPGRLSVMSFYAAFGSLWFGLSNYLGYWAEGGVFEEMFFDFEIREFFFQGQIIATLAVLVPLLSYDVIERNFGMRMRLTVPKIGFEMPDWLLARCVFGFFAVSWIPYAFDMNLAFLGIIAALLSLGTYIAIFALSSRWQIEPRPQWPLWMRWAPLMMAIGEAIYFAVFGGERGRVAWPLVAFSLPYILHKKIRGRTVFVGLLFFVSFTFIFKQLAETRRSLWGADRIQYVLQKISPDEAQPVLAADVSDADRADSTGALRLMARLSTFNQLTQVYRLSVEDGYYNGETMAYMIYVFIPRVLWADKPLVAPGQWFASKLGRGSRLEGGGFSNAINMTIPGELYLNFGWLGVVFGLIGLTVMYFLFWEATKSVGEIGNILGQAFSFALLYQAIFNGSHFGGVVNLTMWYLLFLAITYFVVTIVQQGRWDMFKRIGVNAGATTENSLSILPQPSAEQNGPK